MPDPVADAKTYRQAAGLNLEDPLLDGSLLRFPNFGQLVMTGDLHGHQRNLERIQSFCDLAHAPARHVVLHEIIHAEPDALPGPDTSHHVLLRAARWKCEYPDQVHFIQGNHELSQLTDHDISKGGRLVTQSFIQGVSETYGIAWKDVYQAILEFLRSFALAGRTANRILLSHSLPGRPDLDQFDPHVFEQPLDSLDLAGSHSVYCLVWGRYQTADVLDQLAKDLDVDWFICGHQPQEDGYEVLHDRLVIIASDHNHGVFIPIDLGKSCSMESLLKAMRPLAAVP
jgi:hypothetical protein